MDKQERSAADGQRLKRQLRLPDAVGIGVGAVVGAGIFVITGLAAGVAGPSFLLSLLIAAFAAACNGLSSAQLAAAMPSSGGTYYYASRKLAPAAGFSAGFLFLVSKLSAGAVVALGFGRSFASAVGGVPPTLAAVLLIGGLVATNLFGIRKAGRLNLFIVAVTVSGLFLFVLFGAGQIRSGHYEPFFGHGAGGVLEAAALLFFAFTGYARITTLGDEVVDPKRTIPRAVVTTLAVTTLLYAAVAFVAVGLVGSQTLAGADAPLLRAAEATGRAWLPALLTAASLTALAGVLLSQIAGISRMLYAMSEGHDLPAWLGRVDGAIPRVAVLVTGALLLILTLVGTIPFVARSASFSILLYYSLANLSALRQPRSERLVPPIISALGLVFCLVLAAFLDLATIGSGLGLLAAGFVLRAFVRHYRKNKMT